MCGQVQSLVCGWGQRPCVIVNPDLEALLLHRRRVGRPTPPMLLGDFRHAYFLAAAPAPPGHIAAVRRVWGAPHGWEVYRRQGTPFAADVAAGGGDGGFALLAQTSQGKPPIAEDVARSARRARALQGGW